MSIKVNFEMGTISPRNRSFDHHGPVSHSNNFIVKMASVQLIEWMMITGNYDIALELNHCGHLDDMVAHAAMVLAEANDKEGLVALYGFACRTSVLDSCGPSAYCLIDVYDKSIVDEIDDLYNRCKSDYLKENPGVAPHDVSLEEQRWWSVEAGRRLLSLLNPPHPLSSEIIKTPEEGDFEILKSKGKRVLIDCCNPKVNPFTFSSYFYSEGFDVVVFSTAIDGGYKYTILCSSPYAGDLSGLWDELNAVETADGSWGGHSGAGGSPRGLASGVTPEKVFELLKNN